MYFLIFIFVIPVGEKKKQIFIFILFFLKTKISASQNYFIFKEFF